MLLKIPDTALLGPPESPLEVCTLPPVCQEGALARLEHLAVVLLLLVMLFLLCSLFSGGFQWKGHSGGR